MKTWKTYLVVAAVLLCATAIIALMFAEPVWAQVRAALVRDVDNPDRQADLRLSGTISLSDGGGVNTDCTNVPAGKRWVIEHFSASTRVDAGQFVEYRFGVNQSYYFDPAPITSPVGSGNTFATSAPILIRASAGYQVCLTVTRGPDLTGHSTTYYSIAGYELDYP